MAQSSFQGFPSPRPNKGGTNTGDATATAADIALGKTAYSVGVKVTGTGSNIRSIQRGIVTSTTATLDVTITAIDLTASIVKISYDTTTTFAENAIVSADIINSTTVRFYKLGTSSANIAYEVIEFNNVKSLQSGVNALTTSSTIQPITTVNLNKSMIFASFDGTNAAGTSSSVAETGLTSEIYTVSSVRFVVKDYLNACTVRWKVIEFN